MRKMHDLRDFENLDSLLKEDFINGRADYSSGILCEVAGFIMENAAMTGEKVLKGAYVLDGERLEKRSPGVMKFLDGLGSISLTTLSDFLSNQVYIFDRRKDSVQTILPSIENSKVIYGWAYRDKVSERDPSFFGRYQKPDKESFSARKFDANLRYSVADAYFLSSDIKKNALLLFYDEDEEKPMYALNGKIGGKFIKKIEGMGAESKKGLFSALKYRLFIEDSDRKVYQLEKDGKGVRLTEYGQGSERGSIIKNLINKVGDDDLYG